VSLYELTRDYEPSNESSRTAIIDLLEKLRENQSKIHAIQDLSMEKIWVLPMITGPAWVCKRRIHIPSKEHALFFPPIHIIQSWF